MSDFVSLSLSPSEALLLYAQLLHSQATDRTSNARYTLGRVTEQLSEYYNQRGAAFLQDRYGQSIAASFAAVVHETRQFMSEGESFRHQEINCQLMIYQTQHCQCNLCSRMGQEMGLLKKE